MMMKSAGVAEGSARDWITGINHIALPVRNIAEAARFWTDLFEAEPFGRDDPGRPNFHFQLPGVVLALFERPGVIGIHVEYPHYGFTATAEGLRRMKRRLEEAGVKTHQPWTRNRREALMYFRDPSGNLFELYCPDYDRPEELALAKQRGGDFHPDVDALFYDWKG
jgi:catechol 2,3-dioxygenase-like lactoylglutathione lyase family enzyme